MSVLKAHSVAGIRAFAAAMPTKPVAQPAPDPRLAILADQLFEAEQTLTALREQAAADVAAARLAGATDACRDEDRRIRAIEQGVSDALAMWGDRLDSLERLAVMLAQAALARIFDDPADLNDMVARTLGKRLRTIDVATILRVRVSDRDFADDDALAQLSHRCGLPADTLVADTNGGAGMCEIDLVVGHLDLSVARQWTAIEQGLAAIARDEPA